MVAHWYSLSGWLEGLRLLWGRFNGKGAVGGMSPFPVAGSPEATPPRSGLEQCDGPALGFSPCAVSLVPCSVRYGPIAGLEKNPGYRVQNWSFLSHSRDDLVRLFPPRGPVTQQAQKALKVKSRIETLLSQLLVLFKELREFEEHKPVNPFVRRKIGILLMPEKNPLLLADLFRLLAKTVVVFGIKGGREGHFLCFAGKTFRESGDHPEHEGFSVDRLLG